MAYNQNRIVMRIPMMNHIINDEKKKLYQMYPWVFYMKYLRSLRKKVEKKLKTTTPFSQIIMKYIVKPCEITDDWYTSYYLWYNSTPHIKFNNNKMFLAKSKGNVIYNPKTQKFISKPNLKRKLKKGRKYHKKIKTKKEYFIPRKFLRQIRERCRNLKKLYS
jgi:hypothetical protein